MVNRIWHHLFGRSLVPSVDNFGKMGEQPSHPELLDYLAVQFMDQGWSVKSVIREIMLSRTYQLSTGFHRANFENDPDNKFLWRMNRRRLEVEAIRDAMLYVSGELKLEPPRGSPVHRWKRNGQVRAGNKQLEPWDVEQNYRSVYVPVIRTQLSQFFETFDFPEASETHGARDVTTVATQALFFMNSPFVRRQASAASERLLASTADDRARVGAGVPPSPFQGTDAAGVAAGACFCSELLRHDETDRVPGVTGATGVGPAVSGIVRQRRVPLSWLRNNRRTE